MVITKGTIGYCSGVKRALKMVEEAAGRYGKVNVLGDLVHNRTVVDALSTKNITKIESIDQIDAPIVATTAHGTTPKILEKISIRGAKPLDTTCPQVRKVQDLIDSLDDYFVVIFSDGMVYPHPEVESYLGHLKNGTSVFHFDMLNKIPNSADKIAVVSQTTVPEDNYHSFIGSISLHRKEVRIFNTICPEVIKRQKEVKSMAETMDSILIVGSIQSNNTNSLREISMFINPNTQLIEDKTQIIKDKSGSGISVPGRHMDLGTKIGIAAGASTPPDVILEVERRLRNG